MKKFLYTLLILCAITELSVAQDAPKRPENIGVSDFDGFKNNSFDILDESTKLKQDATQIDKEIKGGAAGVLSSLSVEKLRQDYKALTGISKSSQALVEKMGDLDNQGKQLLTNAKNVNPRTKSPVATSNTNKSIKGLEMARKNLDATSALVEENSKLILEELNNRGESVD
jgi:hypothetical protein